ncbi:nucleoside phosphorylase domain-containing protein [Penicillium citrinum]|uniref:Nucleoside phosphorylase domain-containing protein n=1 Tax=Penicillium citrinum TaxID=5077 RepID=A0A9W9P4P1_PENCI|nr:nucleoside phosphorylase domain-containing protein [Penicillium citrinum]KAJ5235398.1 nucleoside phosphorylase domain-containing protein [Penicillium citrinum]
MSTKWDNFTHKNIFTDAVEECLRFDGLMGKAPSSDSLDSHAGRREMLHRRVVSRLEWLNRSFLVRGKKTSYLSAKRVASGLALDTYCQATEYGTSTTNTNLDQPSLNGPLDIHTQSSINYHSSVKGSRYILPTAPKQSGKRKRPIHQGDFEIAIICALTIEADAIEAQFDNHWDDYWPCYGKATGDSNAYTTGSIGPHNVVLIHMPGMGKGSAASVAANCRGSFPDIKLAIVVGVCGTVPFVPGTNEEIVLGDVIVSDGIVQYDLGRRHPDRFERKDTLLDSLGRPNTEIRGILAKLRGIRSRKTLHSNMSSYLDELRKETELKAEYPGTQTDKLFAATCHHAGGSMLCQMSECRDQPVFRHRLAQGTPQPAVHFGLIASGDTVMKSGEERDAMSRRENVVGFEMEGAGVWDIFPCVVIKGACDYADSHKTKVFQRYAAATAASCAKAFLNHWVPSVRDRK